MDYNILRNNNIIFQLYKIVIFKILLKECAVMMQEKDFPLSKFQIINGCMEKVLQMKKPNKNFKLDKNKLNKKKIINCYQNEVNKGNLKLFLKRQNISNQNLIQVLYIDKEYKIMQKDMGSFLWEVIINKHH